MEVHRMGYGQTEVVEQLPGKFAVMPYYGHIFEAILGD